MSEGGSTNKKAAAYFAAVLSPKILKIAATVLIVVCVTMLMSMGSDMYVQNDEAAAALIDAGHEELRPVVDMIKGSFLMLASAITAVILLISMRH